LKRFYIYAGICLALFGIGALMGAMEMDFFLLFFLGRVWRGSSADLYPA
jgi:hypothetical protein